MLSKIATTMRYLPTNSVLAPIALALAVCSAAVSGQEATKFGNWTAKCEETKGDVQGGCFIYQNLVLRQGGQRVLQFAVGFVADTEEPIALLSLPLGISLPPGVSIRIGDGDPTQVIVERCEPNGCRAGLKLKKALMQQMREGKQLTVTFHDARRHPIEVPLSLDGFEASLNSLKVKS